MLGLVAEHADQWNAAWYGYPDQADELRTRLNDLRAALDAAGRDPASLALTVGIFVAFDGGVAMTSRTARSGARWRNRRPPLAGYRDLGVSHLIAHVWPRTPEAVGRLPRRRRWRATDGVPVAPDQSATRPIRTWRTARRARRIVPGLAPPGLTADGAHVTSARRDRAGPGSGARIAPAPARSRVEPGPIQRRRGGLAPGHPVRTRGRDVG